MTDEVFGIGTGFDASTSLTLLFELSVMTLSMSLLMVV